MHFLVVFVVRSGTQWGVWGDVARFVVMLGKLYSDIMIGGLYGNG